MPRTILLILKSKPCHIFWTGCPYTNVAYQVHVPQATYHFNYIRIDLFPILWLFFSGFFPWRISFIRDFGLRCKALIDYVLHRYVVIVGYINSGSFYSSGKSATYGACISFWRFLKFEADWWKQLLLPQECEDLRVYLCKKLGWANMSRPQERSVTWVCYIGHPLWLEVFWRKSWKLLVYGQWYFEGSPKSSWGYQNIHYRQSSSQC